MNAQPTATRSDPMLGALRGLLLIEAAAALAVTIVLSVVAGEIGGSDKIPIQFAAGGTFLGGILAATASRGVRRRKGWGWTLAAILQVVVAIGTGLAVLNIEWHPALLIGFGLPTLVMLVLSSGAVREALGQP
jgi:hypothetical protein